MTFLPTLTPLRQFHGHAEKVEDRAKDQIEYVNEDTWVQEKFEGELAQSRLTSLMLPEAYADPSFEWNWSPFLKSGKEAIMEIYRLISNQKLLTESERSGR